jgi:hypothetical protein
MSLKNLLRKLYNFLNLVNQIFLVISCKINSPYLSAISWNISLFLLNFKNKNNPKKKVLILYKSYGSNDIELLKKNKKNEFNFFYFPRKNIKIIFNNFFNEIKHDLNDDKYYSQDQLINETKTKYRNFLKKTVEIFNSKHNFLSIISFNFRYTSEKELHSVCKLLNIKFIVCQKESLHFNDDSAITKLYIETNSKNGEFKGDYLTVYTQKFKEVLVSASVSKPENIFVIGMPRADFYFSNLKKEKKHILYLVPSWKPPKILEKEFSFDQKKYSESVTNVVFDFAVKNPKETIVVKLKMSTSADNFLENSIKEKKIKNIILKKGGTPENLIIDAKAVIGFQSSGLIEALILKKPIIIPYFNVNTSQKFKECTLRLEEIAHYAYNPDSMLEYLNNVCNDKISFSETQVEKVRNIINHYIGNNDGKSSDKLLDFLNKTLN